MFIVYHRTLHKSMDFSYEYEMFYYIQFVNLAQRSDLMPNSKARIEANKRYAQKTYKRYAINTRLEYVPTIEAYMTEHGFTSSSSLFNAAVKYCVENNINLKGDANNE